MSLLEKVIATAALFLLAPASAAAQTTQSDLAISAVTTAQPTLTCSPA